MEANGAVIGVLVVAVGAAVAVVLMLWERARFQRTGVRRSEELEDRFQQRAVNLDQRDERLTRREETLEAKARTLELREANLLDRERNLTAQAAELEDAVIGQRKRLEEIAEYTTDEARQALIERVEEEARGDAAALVRDVENRAREEAQRRAQEIVATAVQRVAVDTGGTLSVSMVALPDDDMKGRIIGRDGRNIRAFEQVTGVNLVVDDTPQSVLLSCFDPLRREVARLTLTALVTDGRIHPAAIESEHKRAILRVGEEVARTGQQAGDEARVAGLNPDLVRLLGELQYRTSYGQNVLRHCVETAHIGGTIAEELGMSGDMLRRCGLLHDIGKALTHEVQGSHAAVGAEIARRLGEPMLVCHAIEAHHGEVEFRSIEAVITQAADAISAARPGARRDAHEQYITRLRRIEQLCGSHEGVERVYAMQAGRDVRVMVRPEVVSDDEARGLAATLAQRIESELQYPGHITITVVRELRATGIAR
jgi:ribonuclease Y